MPAHLFAHQLANGVIPRLGWSDAEDGVICHQCDFSGCTNPAHMQVGTNATNRFEYLTRRRDVTSPLADVRAGPARHEHTATIEMRIRVAELAGIPLTIW